MKIRDFLLLKDPFIIDFLQLLAKETKLQSSALVEIDLNKIKSFLPQNTSNYLSYFDKSKIALLKKIMISQPFEQDVLSEILPREFPKRTVNGVCFEISAKDFFEYPAKALSEKHGFFYFDCDINKIETILSDGKNIKIPLPKNQNKKNRIVGLFLSATKGLYLKDNPKKCYPIDAKSDRYALIKYFANNKGLHETSDLSRLLSGKNKTVLRSEIGNIRRMIKKHLSITDKDIIMGKKNSGYGLSEKYRIEIVS